MPDAVVVPENTGDQVASPVASDMRSLPSHGDPPVILIVPATSSLAPGFVVPIPIDVPLSKS